MSLPKWIEKLTVKTGPCQMCGPKCNDADKLMEALSIAVEALEYVAKYSNDPPVCITVHKTLQEIENLGGKRA